MNAVHSVSTATYFRCAVLTTPPPCLSPQDGQITPADSDKLLSAWLPTVKMLGRLEQKDMLVCMGVKLGILYDGKCLG